MKRKHGAGKKTRRKPPVGAQPGTIVVDPGAPSPRMQLIRFDEQGIEERAITRVAELTGPLQGSKTCWIDVQGLGDAAILGELGKILAIHPLALEDIAHAHTRPKAESYGDQLLIVTQMLQPADGERIDAEQVSLLVGRNYVVTFQERYGDVLEPVRKRLRSGSPRIRGGGSGYLAYALLDTIVDAYFPAIESIVDPLEALEEVVMIHPTPQTLRRLNRLKATLVRVRRAVAPQREVVNSMLREEGAWMTDDARIFLRDTYDHCIVASESIESAREFVNGLLNTYLTVVSNRMNEVMKTLTIVASIFVPLTFLAGIYGMNFEWMPELSWKGSYPLLLAVMALTTVGMLLYFRSKGWLGGSQPKDDEP